MLMYILPYYLEARLQLNRLIENKPGVEICTKYYSTPSNSIVYIYAISKCNFHGFLDGCW